MYHIHPLILNPAESLENNKARSSLNRLPYPLIDLNWEGFTVPYLHWIGIKSTKPKQREQLIKLGHLHELALSPFSLLKKREMYTLYHILLNVFDKDKERIEVPLTADQSGNMLQKQWRVFESLTQASMLVEEVFAVRMSVLAAREKGLITDDIWLDKVLSHYKVLYGKIISRFEEVYNEYDFIAKGLGEELALALIFKTLETVNPSKAFSDILFSEFPIAICITYLRTPSSEKLNIPLSKPTNEQSHHLVSWFMDQLDPDGSHYQRTSMLKIEPMIKRELIGWAQIMSEFGETSIFSDSPNDFLFSEYTDTIDSLYKIDASTRLIYGKLGHGACLFLVLEGILQQLITGIGLLCPLWGRLPNDYPDNCCQNRWLLEGVWECTLPDRSKCELWQRMGCLAKEPTVPINPY